MTPARAQRGPRAGVVVSVVAWWLAGSLTAACSSLDGVDVSRESSLVAPPVASTNSATTSTVTTSTSPSSPSSSATRPAPTGAAPAVASDCQARPVDGIGLRSDLSADPAAPEPASGYRAGLVVVQARTMMVATSNAWASAAGCAVLMRGGSAADAAVAVQAVLGLVVPEATGLGSGGFMLYFDASTKTVQSYDGRESAPSAATPDDLRHIDAADHRPPMPNVRESGRSIGTPGVPRLLERVHREHGKLRWSELFGDATRLARDGFRIGGRLAAAIASNASNLRRDADAAATFLESDGSPKRLGGTLVNRAYAETLSALATGGADAFYTGVIAAGIVSKIGLETGADGSAITPGKTTLADLAGYRAKRNVPVCTTYRKTVVCGAPPPSSGGITVASALGILENFDLAPLRPTAIDGEGGKPTVAGVHLIAEAERLAYADRDRYVADTDFVPLPGGTWNTLLDKAYLRRRAGLVRLDRSMGSASPGTVGAVSMGIDDGHAEHGTNQFTIVDREGSVLTATTTVESSMGSFHMTHGFLLNNQLTDFADAPFDASGRPVANRLEPGKRPRSSMAPTLVFDLAADGSIGEFAMATGSAGGALIPQHVVKVIVGSIDWGLDAQQSAGLIDFGAFNGPVTLVAADHPDVDAARGGADDPLLKGLRALGHRLWLGAQPSGVNTIARGRVDGRSILYGGTDPRREGVVLGDSLSR